MLDKWETRASRWGALDMFKAQTDAPGSIISDDLKTKAIAAAGSSLQVPVIDYDAGVQVTNQTIPLVVTDSASTSQLVSITFTHYYFGFLIHPAAHFNNEISMQRDFNAKFEKKMYAMAKMMDDAALAALEASKTQVLGDTLGGRYALTSNVIVGPLAEQDAVVGDINPLMAGNDFFGNIHVVANGSMESHIRNRLLEKGQFNSEDKQYQYNDKIWHFTNGLANGAGHKATAFAVQSNAVGLLQQFAPDCVMGNRTHKHLWDIETLPILNMPIGVYQYDDAVDGSALHGAASAHLTATKAEAYAFHHAVAYITPYNSAPVTRASAVAKVAIATT
jgi:hypothetical protein